MDCDELRCVLRVRVLVLEQILAAGGKLRPGQLARAFPSAPSWSASTSRPGALREGTVVKEADSAKQREGEFVAGSETEPWREETL